MAVDFEDPFNRENQGQRGTFLQEKARSNLVPLETVRTRTVGSSPLLRYTGYAGDYQATLSKNTHWPHMQRMLRKGANTAHIWRRQDVGSSFFTKRVHMSKLPPAFSYSGQYPKTGQPAIVEQMSGYRWPCTQAYNKSRASWSAAFEAIDTRVYSELIALGSEGIAKALPTVPPSSAVVFLGELAQDLPKIPGLQLKSRPTLGGAASEFLNYTFGIQPTVDDVTTMISTTAKAEEILAQYRRDSGRQIRRRVELLDESETTTTTHRVGYHPVGYTYIDPLGATIGTCTHRVITRKRAWFSGSFTYSVPDLESRLSKLREFDRLYGVIPTAKDVWDLTPWSWLIDWNLTTGSIIKNFSTLGRDGLRLHHGYVMMEVSRTYQYERPSSSVEIVEYTKSRIRANPFGFGLRPGSLSNKQKAILSALAISRWDN